MSAEKWPTFEAPPYVARTDPEVIHCADELPRTFVCCLLCGQSVYEPGGIDPSGPSPQIKLIYK